jgi:hypothetical protein
MKDIKDYRERELSLYVVANVLIFLIVHGVIKIDTSDLQYILPDRLPHQMFFGTPRVVSLLRFIERRQIR